MEFGEGGWGANVVTDGEIIKAFEKKTRLTQGSLEATQSTNPVSPNCIV